MANKKNNLGLILIGAVALFYFLKKKKKKATAPIKTSPTSFISPTNYDQASVAVSQAVEKLNFVPANDSDRLQYSKDQKFCK